MDWPTLQELITSLPASLLGEFLAGLILLVLVFLTRNIIASWNKKNLPIYAATCTQTHPIPLDMHEAL